MSQQPAYVYDCEVCGQRSLPSVLNLGSHPLCDDLVPIGSSRICTEYPIEVLFCDVCRTGHQRVQVPKKLLFPAAYHYRARFTTDVLNGMSELVSSCRTRFGGLSGKLVLDIGCNDGSLLNFFRNDGARTIGIEPTGAYQDAIDQGHITYNEFLSDDVAREVVRSHGYPDLVTFTNVFAHIDDLKAAIASLRLLLNDSSIVVIENHYLGAILKGTQFDTFYHEHPRSYSLGSFIHIARALDRDLIDAEFPARYGGNIRVFLGPAGGGSSRELAEAESIERNFLEMFTQMRTRLERWRSTRSKEIKSLVRQFGPLRAKAFPGRAAILINLLGLGLESIAAVHEKPGSKKIGHYVPGTRIPIVSDDELLVNLKDLPIVLNLAWHIPAEIRNYLQMHGYRGRVVDIVEQSDFTSD